MALWSCYLSLDCVFCLRERESLLPCRLGQSAGCHFRAQRVYQALPLWDWKYHWFLAPTLMAEFSIPADSVICVGLLAMNNNCLALNGRTCLKVLWKLCLYRAWPVKSMASDCLLKMLNCRWNRLWKGSGCASNVMWPGIMVDKLVVRSGECRDQIRLSIARPFDICIRSFWCTSVVSGTGFSQNDFQSGNVGGKSRWWSWFVPLSCWSLYFKL